MNSEKTNNIENNENNSANNLNLQTVDAPAQNKNATEIDLFELLQYYLQHWKVILLALVLGAAIGYGYQHFYVGTTYVSDASMYITASDQIINITNLSMSSLLSEDYKKILKSRKTMKDVIKELGLNMSYEQLSGIVSVSQDENTHIITISATTDDPELTRQIVDTMVRVGQQRIQEITTTGDATVVDYATTDAVKARQPGLKKYTAMGALIGLLIPLILLLIQFIMDNSFKNEEEVVSKLKKPVLSVVPYYGEKNLVSAELNYYEKEAFNTLYGNISLSGDENRVIAVTSSNANEGKSALSFKLAEIITVFNKTACYVDADMRNSNFCKQYGIDRKESPGLSGYLSGNASVKSVLFRDDKNDKLFVLQPGTNPPSPSALLSGERFSKLIEELREMFDYVIIDTPPVNAVIDGIFVAKKCDGTILVVESSKTDTRQAMRALNELNMSNVNVLGVVVNKVGRRKGYGYGYGYGYGKKYGYGGRPYGYGYGYGAPEGFAATVKKTVKKKK